jgi:hypothetical protein
MKNYPLLTAFTSRALALGGGMCPSRAVLEFPLMERAGKGLWSALRQVARPDKPLDLLVAVWPLMVGRRLADHTRPIAWSKGRVAVAVDQPEWQGQLESMGKDVREQVNKWWGSELVREVRFVSEKAKRQRPAATQGDSARPAEAAGASNRTLAENKLSAVLKELEPALNRIEDADLRELISRVAGQYLHKQAGK